jgi:hypothetical protein
MQHKKKLKPSKRIMVFHKKTSRWLTLEEEAALMELEAKKQELERLKMASETITDDLDDEPHDEETINELEKKP